MFIVLILCPPIQFIIDKFNKNFKLAFYIMRIDFFKNVDLLQG